MLQNIRDKAQGWIAWAIVILISIPFALWGIQEYLGTGSEPVVASVNGEEITERALDQRYERFRQELRDQLGAAYRPELLDDKRMRDEILKRMVSENVVLQASHDMGLRVGNPLVTQAIMQIDAFQRNGRFDQETFERHARMQGMSSGGFEERIRQALLSEQLSQAMQTSAFITAQEIRETFRLQNQTRDVAYFVIPTTDYMTNDTISEEEIQAYYGQHKENYRIPEQIKLEYILLNGEMAGKTVQIDEAGLQGYYDDHQENYGQPEERQASHILIKLDKGADQTAVDEVKQRITVLRERVEQGEDFAELAKSHSEDPGSASEGGDLGYFGKGIMDPAFEAAAFSLQEGGLSEPVQSSFGFHLIKITGIKPGSIKPFEEVRTDVEQAYRKAEGDRLYFEMAEQLADLSYEDPSSLEPAASDLKLEIQTSDWISRDNAQGVLQSPKVTSAAFSEDVLIERNNSELIELDREQSIVLRVVDHKESSIKPLAEVSEDVTASLKQLHAVDQARTEAEKRLARLEAGEEVELVADQYKVRRNVALQRSVTSVPRVLISQLFRMPHPVDGKPVTGMSQLTNGGFAVYSLYGVKNGSETELSPVMKDQLTNDMRRRTGRSHYDSLVADLEQRANISYLTSDEEE